MPEILVNDVGSVDDSLAPASCGIGIHSRNQAVYIPPMLVSSTQCEEDRGIALGGKRRQELLLPGVSVRIRTCDVRSATQHRVHERGGLLPPVS